MKNSFLYLLGILVLISFSACSGDEEPDDISVFVGQGIGELKLGDTGRVAAEIFGSNYAEINTSAGPDDYLYYMLYSSKDFQLALGIAPIDSDIETLNVRSILMFDDFAGKTQEGIGIGSTASEVIAAYGPADIDTFFFTTYSYDEIFFTLEDDVVTEMTLITP